MSADIFQFILIGLLVLWNLLLIGQQNRNNEIFIREMRRIMEKVEG